MRLNPLIRKEITVSGRSGNLAAFIAVINSVLFLSGLLLLFGNLLVMEETESLEPRSLLLSWPVTVLLLLLIVIFILPGRTVSLIAKERDSGTLDLLIASGMTPLRIVSGKFFSEFLMSAVILLSTIPAIFLPLLFGGVRFESCLFLMALLLLGAVFSLSAGLFGGAQGRAQGRGAALSYALLLFFAAGPALIAFLLKPLSITGGNYAVWLLLLSPETPVLLLLSLITGQTGLIGETAAFFGYSGPLLTPLKLLFVSAGLGLLTAVLFFAGSVRAVNRGRER